jgi:proteasome lid subunit RPN8/RPN11
MTVRISRTDYDAIAAHAIKNLPCEACGLIAGRSDGEIKTVGKIYPLSNPDHSPEHFSIDPREQLAAVKDMRASGLEPLGNFHSHPSSPARPSEEDVRLAHDAKAVYLIVSLAEDKPVLNAFGIAEGKVTQRAVEIF